MSIVMKLFKFVIVSFIVLAIPGAMYQNYASKRDESAHQPVGKLIDIGGYKLHMIDSSIGDMTVVIDSGAGGKTLDWCLVQPEIAKFARVITYDRAGYGWSDASPLERTSENIVEELHTMLDNAKIPAPYILVGHSFGGLNVRLFASKYPEKVAGVVLVDAMHENMFDILPQLRPNTLFLWLVNAASYVGFFRLLDLLPSQQKKMHDAIAKYPVFLQRIYDDQMLTTKYMNAMTCEALHFDKSCKQLKIAGGLLDNKPLTVMTVDKPYIQKNGAVSARDEVQNKGWSELQADLVTKSSLGKQIMVYGEGRNILYDRPQVIVDAVHLMVTELKPVK